MNLFQKHYYNVVQRDLVLSENISTVSLIPAPKKISLCLGGENTKRDDVISSVSVLKIISGQHPYLTQEKNKKQKINSSNEAVGGKVTLRKSNMYTLWYKILFGVLPQVKQFEGLTRPAHKSVYCFRIKDIFVFQELVPLFPYFENVKCIQFQYHFDTETKDQVLVLGRGLQLCFVDS